MVEITPITLTPERRAELDDYAKRHGEDLQTALDDVLADYFAWERQDHDETVMALLEGNEDRTKPAAEVYASLRLKHGLQD